MKILYVASADISLKRFGYMNDFMRDLLYHGLFYSGVELYSSSVLYNAHKSYKDKIDTKALWGRGFTASFIIDQDPNVADDIENKIKDRYFDAIIYGDFRACADYFNIVSEVYDPKNVLLVDGRDDQVLTRYADKYLCFKRELGQKRHNARPISFAIPESKIVQKTAENHGSKDFYLASSIPYNIKTLDFCEEEEYYKDYQKSFFAITMQKSGWDCLRHYEIIANGCVPIFMNISNCPDLTLFNFPKHLCEEAFEVFKNFDLYNYMSLNSRFMCHLREHNTTRSLARYVLGHLG